MGTALPGLHRNPNPNIFVEKTPLPTLPDLHRRVPTVICVQNSVANTAPEPKSKYIRQKTPLPRLPDLHRRVPTVIYVQNSVANTALEPKSKYIRRKNTVANVARPAP